MPEKCFRMQTFHKGTHDLVIFALKTDYNNENLMPYRLMADAWPLSYRKLFKTRLI